MQNNFDPVIDYLTRLGVIFSNASSVDGIFTNASRDDLPEAWSPETSTPHIDQLSQILLPMSLFQVLSEQQMLLPNSEIVEELAVILDAESVSFAKALRSIVSAFANVKTVSLIGEPKASSDLNTILSAFGCLENVCFVQTSFESLACSATVDCNFDNLVISDVSGEYSKLPVDFGHLQSIYLACLNINDALSRMLHQHSKLTIKFFDVSH